MIFDINDIHRVDASRINEILNYPKASINSGLFYAEDEVGEWIAIDNTSGNPYTITFKKSYSALNWLLLNGGKQHV